MEIKINKEIRDYSETLFFGLTLRQFLCAACAIVLAAGVYVFGQKILGKEVASWLCMLAATPFAALGFFKYHGMPAEKFVRAYFRASVLGAGRRLYRSENIYYLAFQACEQIAREEKRRQAPRKRRPARE
jgi:hypothetical protein